MTAFVIRDAGLDVAELRHRFRLFEALHRGLDICAPVATSDLSAAVDAMDLAPSHRVIDLACGHGALLGLLASEAGEAVGVDLSPAALDHTAAHLAELGVPAELWLGDAAGVEPEPIWDRVACVGASWVFHGFAGTVTALRRRLRPGGVAAIGDLRAQADAERAPGGVVAASDQHAAVVRAGGDVVADIVSSSSTWQHYRAAMARAVTTVAAEHADLAEDAAAWLHHLDHDSAVLEFAIVVARFP